MGNCLLSVCPDACTNTDLPLLGEMQIPVRCQDETPGAIVITLAASAELTVRADGSGTFLSSDGSETLGASMTVPADTPTTMYPASGDYNIRVVSKYALTQIDFSVDSSNDDESSDDSESSGDGNESQSATDSDSAVAQGSVMDVIAEIGAFVNRAAQRHLNPDDPDRSLEFPLKGLEYATGLLRYHDAAQSSEGNLAAFANLAALRHIHIEESDGNVYGDLAAFAGKPDLSEVRLALKKDFLAGNISAFEQATNLTEVVCCQSARVTGDISVFADKTELTAICLDSLQFSG